MHYTLEVDCSLAGSQSFFLELPGGYFRACFGQFVQLSYRAASVRWADRLFPLVFSLKPILAIVYGVQRSTNMIRYFGLVSTNQFFVE